MTLGELRERFKKYNTINKSLKHLCGDKVGYGLYRDVYAINGTDKYVLKIERRVSLGIFSNACEWRNWVDNGDNYPKLSKWLAPCVNISSNGQIMIQRRVISKDKSKYPKLIPSVFTDLKYSNFGWIGKQFVCCDYSYLKLTDFRMVRANWWDHVN